MHAAELIERIRAIGDEEAERITRIASQARRLLRALEKEGLVNYIDSASRAGMVGGVDGFYTLIASTPGRRIYAYRVVGVEAGAANARLIDVLEDVVAVQEAGGSEELEEYIEYMMMRREAEMAAALSGTMTVLLDGPIVDPPHEPYTSMSQEGHAGYHEWRSRLLRGRMVVGYVKRVRGRRLASLLGLQEALGDAETAYLILWEALREAGAAAAWIGPLEPGEGDPYSLYEGLEAAYILLPWWLGVRGVEAWDARRGAELVASATPRGLQHPAPVQVAHEEAGRLASGVEALRRALLSRLAERVKGLGAAALTLKTI